jgi:hypothetical protein
MDDMPHIKTNSLTLEFDKNKKGHSFILQING